MVQVLRRRQTPHKAVPIAPVVRSSLDLSQVGHLVQHSRSLVLGVASAAQRGQTAEEQRAVNHLAGTWVCVREHTAGAGA